MNPYQLIANNGFYYLIGNYDQYDNISHYRIDRMTDVNMMEQDRKHIKEIPELKGRFYGENTKKLLLVGRAVNGWDTLQTDTASAALPFGVMQR